MEPTRAFICGCAGTGLTDEERRFIARVRPWGLILFRRNVDSPAQLRQLTQSFRETVERPDAPVLVDQEGGRVQRLTTPHWPVYPPASAFGSTLERDEAAAAARLGARLIAADLRDCGITVDCAPVVDVPSAGSHAVIGNRAFGGDPATVAHLARAFAEGLMAGGVLPVIKHMPGHGRAGVDSHLDVPVVEADLAQLEHIDFAPFVTLADLPMAMTAHVIFKALDPVRPATTSPIVVERIMRGFIGFDGLLLTDDLSMEALKGTLGERAAAAVAAGCDILLHCNGKLDEAEQVAAEARPLEGRSAERAATALALLARAPTPVTTADRAHFAELMGLAA